jgi:LacI family transcriptional regulator
MAEATIWDVARLARVSIATVSRVVNNEESVSKKTLIKVQQAIKEVNYVPNASARNLRTDKSKIIGLLVSDIENNYFTTMAKTIEKTLHKYGYNIVLCNTGDDAEMEKEYLYRLMSLRVDGLIINASSYNQRYIAELSHLLPIVLIERTVSETNFKGDMISSNNFSGIHTLTKYLIDMGHRKISIINARLQVSTAYERMAGFTAAMQEIGITIDSDYPYLYDAVLFNEEGGIQGCKHLISLKDKPTAIIASNNALALGVYKCLHTSSIKIPDNISVLNYGNIQNSDILYVNPSYTTLNPLFIGEKAANHILSRIKNPETNNREVVFEPSLVINNSVRRLL